MANNTKGIFIRVTDEEYEELIRQKEFMDFASYSELIRMFINNNVCLKIDFNGLFEVATQISKIGTNINQIAKAVNESHSITPWQIEVLKNDMKDVQEEMKKVIKEKGNLTKYIARETFGGGNLGSYEDYKS